MCFFLKPIIGFVLLGFVSPLHAGETDAAKVSDHFKPYVFMIDGAWVGRFPDGSASDTQRFEWVYGGKFIRNTHFVTRDGQGTVYEGETIFAWDAEKKQVIYWYWNTLGGYSEGVMAYDGKHFLAQGLYHDPTNGKTMETRSGLEPVSETEYRAVQYFKKDGAWQEQWTMTFQKKE